VSTAGELISHGLALIIPIIVGSIAFALLPAEINPTKAISEPAPLPSV
jgi:hypothetical protein